MELIDKMQKAWLKASLAHQDQTYYGPQPNQKINYLNHLASVSFELMNCLKYEPQLNAELGLCCAVLHDTLEDTSLSYEEIEREFGPAIAQGVAALSKNDAIKDEQAKMEDSLKRIKAQDPVIGAVKMADRICNLQAPPAHWNKQKREKYQAEARLIYQALHEASPYLAQRLAQKIEAYQAFIEET